MRALCLMAIALILLLAVPAVAAAPIRASMTTSSPKPVVDQPWRWTVRVSSAAGKPLAASVRLQILVGTTVVGCWKNGAMAQCLDGSLGQWITFKGKRSGVLTWPAQSLGVR
ncbi:MAG: hypothetical protein ACRDPV_10540, partial [Gaiellaceae bacterium]